jgi:hypothetical protein
VISRKPDKQPYCLPFGKGRKHKEKSIEIPYCDMAPLSVFLGLFLNAKKLFEIGSAEDTQHG